MKANGKSDLGRKLQALMDETECKYHTCRTVWVINKVGAVQARQGELVEYKFKGKREHDHTRDQG